MIELRHLDSFKLVRGENIANSFDTLRAIEEAVVQGSQGWGVIDEQSVLLAVVAELRAALLSKAAAELLVQPLQAIENALKGKQMELGRARKSLDEITKRHGGLLEVIAAQSETIAEVTAERDAAVVSANTFMSAQTTYQRRIDALEDKNTALAETLAECGGAIPTP